MLLFWAVQAVVAGPDLPPTRSPGAGCRSSDEGEVVVCGRRSDDRYRLPPLSPEFEKPTLPKAETALSGSSTLSAVAESVAMPGGETSNRAMIRLRTRF